jgi:hypothetical protein
MVMWFSVRRLVVSTKVEELRKISIYVTKNTSTQKETVSDEIMKCPSLRETVYYVLSDLKNLKLDKCGL